MATIKKTKVKLSIAKANPVDQAIKTITDKRDKNLKMIERLKRENADLLTSATDYCRY